MILVLTFFCRLPMPEAAAPDEPILDEIERRALDYFLDLQHPRTGLILDRANNFKSSEWDYAPASTAAVGFGLAAYIVGAERGWIGRAEAYERCLKALKFYRSRADVHWGFYFHFLDARTGKRMWNSELSTVDTVLFLAGALAAAEYFKGTDVDTIAQELYARVEWPALLSSDKRYISMGWSPEHGKLAANWESYCELMILYLMAIGSPTHPVSPDLWHTWKRPVGEYDGHVSIAIGPLFTHQYSHIWIDFRDKHDRYADYFQNSREATLANRAFCVHQKKKYKTYDDHVWGLTACDGPDGYKAYGAPPAIPVHDGTVAPTAAGGSIVFTPDLSIEALKTMRSKYGEKIWGKYGFSDAFNAGRNWWATDAIGIDQGAMMLMIENHKSGFVWNLFMRQAWLKRSLDAAGFKSGTKTLTAADITLEPVKVRSIDDRPVLEVKRTPHLPEADGRLDDWDADAAEWIELEYPGGVEAGRRSSPEDFSVGFAARRSDEGLAIAVRVKDNDVRNPYSGRDLYRGDLVELYLDPQSDNLQWGSPADYQIGVSPVSGTDTQDDSPDWFAWFQNGRPAGIRAAAAKDVDGYTAEVVLNWSELGIAPVPARIGFSVAAHDLDQDDGMESPTPECKLQWFFLDPGIVLGELRLADRDTGLIADFDSEKTVNTVGGEFGAWDKDPKDTSQGCSIELRDRCLKILYDVDSPRPAYNGLWMKLARFDASPFSRLSFRLKGDAGAGIPKKFKLELKAFSGKASAVVVDDLGPGWRTVRIDKSAFSGITDWSDLSEFVVVFEDQTAGTKTGAIFLDDVRFE